jgi:hypothetical protein
MSENMSHMFPPKRNEQMRRDAVQFDPRDFRADAVSPRAMMLLQGIDPVLAFKVQAGMIKDARFHKDASESLFFARQLEYIRPGLLEVLFPGLEAKDFLPVEGNIPPGAEQYTYRSVNKVGRAQLIKHYSDTPPRVDVLAGESFQRIRGAADMYGYTTQELRAAMMAQMPLDVRKAMAARYGMALLFDEVMWYGHADVTTGQSATGLDVGALEGGMTGLANLTGTTAFTTPSGLTGSQLWRRKTPDEIVKDLHAIVNNVVTKTFGIHRPDTILLPLAAYNMASTIRMGDGSNQTVLAFFLATSPYCKEVKPSYRLDAAVSANWNGTTSPTTGRAIAYEKNPERLTALIPVEFEQMPPQQEHFEIKTACHGRIGGVIAYYPGSVSYMDGITDTTDV